MTDPLTQPEGVKPSSFKPTSRARRRARKLALSYTGIFGAVIFAAVAVSALFLLLAKSIRFEVTPGDANATVSVTGPLVFQSGPSYLVLQGSYRVHATAPGYHDFSMEVSVGKPRIQTHHLEMLPLPGTVRLQTEPTGARVVASDGSELGITPAEIFLEQGIHQLTFQKDRYQQHRAEIDVEGRDQVQEVSATLTPNWATVTLPTTPSNAIVFIDGEDSGFKTPGPFEVLRGEHKLTLRASGYKDWHDLLEVEALEQVTLPSVKLERASGSVKISSSPQGAAVLLEGEYMGPTPIRVDLFGQSNYKVQLVLTGYATESRIFGSSPPNKLHVRLKPVNGTLQIRTDPSDALVSVDNVSRGTGAMTMELQSGPHLVEISKVGHASFKKEIRIQADLVFELPVRLLTDEEARLQALKQVQNTVVGQEIVLLQPSSIRMGAPRNQPGRRANEVYRRAKLTRLFYLSRHEVTNAEYRELVTEHESGSFSNQTLDKAKQPVVGVSWIDAARYCNYLSGREGIGPFYRIEEDQVTNINPKSLGYRLPSEAEWSWAARYTEPHNSLLVFPWGEGLPPPSRFENFADASAQHLIGRTIFGYNDNFLVSAPVGKFAPNQNGIYDMGGNVSEWVHDYYSIPNPDSPVSPLGPETGEYRVIRGASWMHGTITELRLSFRDYGLEGRREVGFRIARYAE